MSDIQSADFELYFSMSKEELTKKLASYSMERAVGFFEEQLNLVVDELSKVIETSRLSSDEHRYDDEYIKAMYTYNLCMKKIQFLKEAIDFCIYARFQTMSPGEVIKNKDDEIDKLSEEISKIAQAKNEALEKRKELEEAIAEKRRNLSSLSPEFVEDAKKELAAAEKTLSETYSGRVNVFTDLKGELLAVGEKIEKLKAMRARDYRKSILTRLGDNTYNDGLMSLAHNKVDSNTLILGSIGEDYDKVLQLLDLLYRRMNIVNYLENPTARFNIGHHMLPSELTKIFGDAVTSEEGNVIVNDGIVAIQKYNDFMEKCRQIKEVIDREYTKDKFEILYYPRTFENAKKFIELHRDKISASHLEKIKDLLRFREKEIKSKAVLDQFEKIFFGKKRGDFKSLMIEEIDANIDEAYSLMIEDVRRWYIDNGNNASKYFSSFIIPFIDPKINVPMYISECFDALQMDMDFLLSLDKMFKDANNSIVQNKRDLDLKRTDVEIGIRKLTGVKNRLVSYMPKTDKQVIKDIQEAALKLYKIAILKEIINMADFQSIVEEANLAGVPVEKYIEKRVTSVDYSKYIRDEAISSLSKN